MTDELLHADFGETLVPSHPLSFCPLHCDKGRRGFLRVYADYGEIQLLLAVEHIWNSLAEPQEARCSAMGVAAGTGGKGKKALVNLLRAFLQEMVTVHFPLPRASDFDCLDEWNDAAQACFAAEMAKEEEIIERYAGFLAGPVPSPSGGSGAAVIYGPWNSND